MRYELETIMLLEKDVYFNNQKNWMRVPNWGYTLTNLGYNFAAISANSTAPVRTAIALPTRAFAAAFIATGTILARVERYDRVESNLSSHFNYLASLEKGTFLYYIKNGRKYKGQYDGIDEVNGEPRIRVKVQQSKNCTDWELIPKNKCLSLHPTENTFKIPGKQKGYPVLNNSSKFVELLIGKESSKLLTQLSSLDCLIIGPVGLLSNEIVETHFCMSLSHSIDSINSGPFQDILRCKHLLSEGVPSRSELLSCNSANPPKNLEKPFAIIFDGALGYLKWRDIFQHAHQFLILDRTERLFEAGIEAVNQDYVNRSNNNPLDIFEEYPNSIECISFTG